LSECADLVQASVPLERTLDYEQHVLSVSVSLKTSRPISSTAFTGHRSVFRSVKFFLYVRHLRDFLSRIQERLISLLNVKPLQPWISESLQSRSGAV
jgi:hypothetical protein